MIVTVIAGMIIFLGVDVSGWRVLICGCGIIAIALKCSGWKGSWRQGSPIWMRHSRMFSMILTPQSLSY